jgi:hypothetical protein
VQVQRLVSIVKKVTVLEVCTTEEQRSVVSFLWAKEVNAKNIKKNSVAFSPQANYTDRATAASRRS